MYAPSHITCDLLLLCFVPNRPEFHWFSLAFVCALSRLTSINSSNLNHCLVFKTLGLLISKFTVICCLNNFTRHDSAVLDSFCLHTGDIDTNCKNTSTL